MMPTELRNLENTDKMKFFGVGQYDIPPLEPVYDLPRDYPLEMVAFNACKRISHPERAGVHFFLEDKQLNRVWTHPEIYSEMLKRYRFVCTPDFSMYTNWPVALQINSHYRKHWIGAFWQKNGMTVIPTINWSDENSYKWCFDGEPLHSIVAVSSVGTQAEKTSKFLFAKGFYTMLERLEPSMVLFYGDIPKTIQMYLSMNAESVKLERILPYHAKLRRMEGREV